jgi:hypothetical protein
MELTILYKILTCAYRKELQIQDDEEIMNFYMNLLDEREVKMGPFKKDNYDIYRAPGSRIFISKDIECIICAFEESLNICLVADNRVYFWKDLLLFEYENFMFHPKYKCLANLIYNFYYEELHDYILYDQPWKLFKSHMAFSPDCKLGDKGPTFKHTLTLCIAMYGEYDSDNTTNIELENIQPWKAETQNEISIQKIIIRDTVTKWCKVETLLYNNISTLELERLLCDIRNPFKDEGYKFIEIAMIKDDLELFLWTMKRYKFDKSRLKYSLKMFVPNDITKLISEM